MTRSAMLWLLGGAALCAGAPAVAQRANENAVTQAGDAFGSSVGNERVGIYNLGNARGFSPIQAGNIRIEGLYFDFQADLDARITAGVAMRVGISAQSYPFSSPTGIADFTIRKPGEEAVLSLVASHGPYGTLRAEADGQVPVTETLGLAGGIGLARDGTHWGARRTILNGALTARWRPDETVELVPFIAHWRVRGTEAQPIYFTGGPWLPPEVERRRFYGPDWAVNDTNGTNYGLIGTGGWGGWTLRAGLFRSELDLLRSATELALGTTQDGIADRFVQLEADRRFASTSGELRLSRAMGEGPRLHTIHATLRGRDQGRRYGGGLLVPLGRGPIDDVSTVPRPDFQVGPQSFDEVRQFTGGIGYELRWRGIGELSASLQKTDYRKAVETPDGPLPVSTARPWLFGATAAVNASDRLTFYAGFTRGLEESPVAPSVARNRDTAAPALITEQMDAGLRFAFGNMRLVAGLFQVTKPYFGLDETMLFTRLGEVRHRGAEFSLSGSPLPGLTAIVGTVLLDAELTGEAVEQGRIGRRPVGSFVRYTNVALDWRVPFAPGFSLDLAYESTSDRVADRMNSFTIPERYVVALGGRYRFDIDGRPATFRAQMGSVNGNYGWVNIGEGFHYNLPRRVSMSLSVDV